MVVIVIVIIVVLVVFFINSSTYVRYQDILTDRGILESRTHQLMNKVVTGHAEPYQSQLDCQTVRQNSTTFIKSNNLEWIKINGSKLAVAEDKVAVAVARSRYLYLL